QSGNGDQIVVIDQAGQVIDSLNIYVTGSGKRSILVSSTGKFHHFTKQLQSQITQSHGRINTFDSQLDSMTWSTELPFNNFTNARRYAARNMIETQNGDILVCGTVWDEGNDGPIANPYDHCYNGFLTRLHPNGNIKWLKLYKVDNDISFVPKNEYGKYLASTIWNIHELEDGRILTGGTIYHTSAQNSIISSLNEPTYYTWLMTVNSNGCLDGEECDEVIIIDGAYRPKDGYLPILNSDQTWIKRSVDILTSSVPFQYTYSEDSVSQTSNYYFEQIQTYQEDGSSTFIEGYYREIDGMIYKKLEGNFNEQLVLDMSLLEGDTISIQQNLENDPQELVVVSVGTVEYLDGIPRKIIELTCIDGNDDRIWVWVEGIGEIFSGEYCMDINGFEFFINCVLGPDGERIYSIVEEDDPCWHKSSSVGEEIGRNISVYPIPSANTITISGLPNQPITGSIYNASGQIVTNTISHQIDISTYSPGLYIVHIITKDNRMLSTKFVKGY
ncbi:MAG: T9SS type A sorting domain-containing protein, partial [Saprospiraceae bacterium]|nr:T9SS type A sorting domain-containing protein [Saprospiraceae bacterium]